MASVVGRGRTVPRCTDFVVGCILLLAFVAAGNNVADAVLCYMCGTPAVPNCHTSPGAVIGCPGGAMCWTLYDSAQKTSIRARGCSMSTKANCQYGPHGVYRCYCGEKHLCNGGTSFLKGGVTNKLMATMTALISGSLVVACLEKMFLS